MNLTSLDLVKILIVDDKESNLDTLEQILKSEDYKIYRADNGQEALKLLLENEFACCLLDVRMPGMDGFQVAEIIRNDPLLQYVPIIFVTAEMADQDAIYKGYERGAVDYILKPVEPKIIRSKVNVFADLFRHRKALEKTKELEELNIKLNKVNQELSTANDELTHFTRLTTHDMIEPTRKLKNFIELLGIELQGATENANHLFNKIEVTSEYIFEMIQDFRAIFDLDYVGLTKSDISISEIIKKKLKWYEEELKDRRVNIIMDKQPEKILADNNLVARIYDNLINNALKHVSETEYDLIFTAEFDEIRGWILGVKNTASSVSESEKEEIFKMFRKGKVADQEGRGLGLSICKRIVERHGGSIWLESEGKYFHVKFTLGG